VVRWVPRERAQQRRASSNPKLSIFVELLKGAGLVKAANGKGPFTVFAPTNADLLQYHVLGGKFPSSAFEATQTGPTVRAAPSPSRATAHRRTSTRCCSPRFPDDPGAPGTARLSSSDSGSRP